MFWRGFNTNLVINHKETKSSIILKNRISERLIRAISGSSLNHFCLLHTDLNNVCFFINHYFDTCHHYGSLDSMPTMSSTVLRRVSYWSIIRPIIGCPSQGFLRVAPQHYQWLLVKGYQIMFMCMVDHFEACHLYDSSGCIWIMLLFMLSEGSYRLLPIAILVPSSEWFLPFHHDLTNNSFCKCT